MSKDAHKSLSELITTGKNSLGDLASQARMREELGDYLRKNLPPELAPGFLHCNLKDGGELVVIVSSPEWASRLRFETSLLADLCRSHGTLVHSVRVKTGS